MEATGNMKCPKCGKEGLASLVCVGEMVVGCDNCVTPLSSGLYPPGNYRVIDGELFRVVDGSVDNKVLEDKILKLEEENVKLRREVYNLKVANEKLHDELVKAVKPLTEEEIQAALDRGKEEMLAFEKQAGSGSIDPGLRFR